MVGKKASRIKGEFVSIEAAPPEEEKVEKKKEVKAEETKPEVKEEKKTEKVKVEQTEEKPIAVPKKEVKAKVGH